MQANVFHGGPICAAKLPVVDDSDLSFMKQQGGANLVLEEPNQNSKNAGADRKRNNPQAGDFRKYCSKVFAYPDARALILPS